MKNKILIAIVLLALAGGCANLEPFTEGPDGSIVANTEVAEQIGLLGTTAQGLGVPYAGLSGEVWVGLAGAIALILNERRRREEQKVNGTLIRSIEKNKGSKMGILEIVKETAIKDGTEIQLKKRVNSVT